MLRAGAQQVILKAWDEALLYRAKMIATLLVSNRLLREKSEERGIELLGTVEHGHMRGSLEDDQPGVGDLLPQQVADRRRD